MLNRNATAKDKTQIIIISILLVLYLEVIAKLSVGKYINYILFVVFVLYSVRNLQNSFFLILGTLVLCLEYPRDILTYTAGQVIALQYTYYTLNSQYLGPITLAQVILIVQLLIAGFTRKFIFSTQKFFTILSMFLISCFSFAANSMVHPEYISSGMVMSDLKFYIFAFIAFFAASSFRGKEVLQSFSKTLFICTIIAGYRVLAFLVLDVISSSIKMDFQPLSYLALGFILYAIYTNNERILKDKFLKLGLYLNLISTSRSFYLILLISFIVIILISKKLRPALIFIRDFLLLFVIVLLILFLYSTSMYNFIMWKLAAFDELVNNNLPGSGKVRVLELKNIMAENFEHISWLLFGRGLGGSYRFDHYPISSVGTTLFSDSYAAAYITSGYFPSVHSFLSYQLLKNGIVGLALYLYFPLSICTKLKNNRFFSVLFVVILLIYSYYWRPEYILIMFFLYGLIINGRMNKRYG